MSLFYYFENGDKFPSVGLGTWRAPDAEVETAINFALSSGYRHFDCAPVYQNEKVIGKVFKEWFDSGKLKREDIFVTTKLPEYGNRASDVGKCLRQSLADLELSYVDMYLIHVPFATPWTDGAHAKHENGDIILADVDHVATWKELERFQSEGLIKHIGVSNFNKNQLQKLFDSVTVKPENLQIEVHVYLQQEELISFCKKHKILVTAYSPLGSRGIEKLLQSLGINRKVPDLVENEVVMQIAERLRKSPAQILLRYLLTLGIAVIPKSTNCDRLRQNIALYDFDLTAQDRAALKRLDANIRVNDFKFFQGIEKHPEFPFEQNRD